MVLIVGARLMMGEAVARVVRAAKMVVEKCIVMFCRRDVSLGWFELDVVWR